MIIALDHATSQSMRRAQPWVIYMPGLVLVSVSASLPPINLCPCQMKINVIWESSGCYLGMYKNRVISGCFWDDLQPGFINILCLIRQLHVKNRGRCLVLLCPLTWESFLTMGPKSFTDRSFWWPKASLTEPRMNIRPCWHHMNFRLCWRNSHHLQLLLSCSSHDCIWVQRPSHLTAVFFPWFLFKFAAMAVLFLITVSPSLLISLAVAFQRRSSKQKDDITSCWVELNWTGLKSICLQHSLTF